MSMKYAGRFVAVRGPLTSHAEGFEAFLEGRGYAARTLGTQMRMLRDLSGWLEDRGVVLEAASPEVFAAYAEHRRARTATLRSPLALVPLLGFLRESAVVPVAVPVEPVGGVEGVLAAFGADLVSLRAVAPATVRSYCSQVCPLVAVFAEGWETLTAERVREFIDEHAACDKPRSVQVRINAVRALCAGCGGSGWSPSRWVSRCCRCTRRAAHLRHRDCRPRRWRRCARRCRRTRWRGCVTWRW